jgi:hypothetical protein
MRSHFKAGGDVGSPGCVSFAPSVPFDVNNAGRWCPPSADVSGYAIAWLPDDHDADAKSTTARDNRTSHLVCGMTCTVFFVFYAKDTTTISVFLN